MRIYDCRIARFLSLDPYTSKFPWYTPYQFSGNIPIWTVDLDGLEEFIKTNFLDVNGRLTKTVITCVTERDNKSKVKDLGKVMNGVDYSGSKVLVITLKEGSKKPVITTDMDLTTNEKTAYDGNACGEHISKYITDNGTPYFNVTRWQTVLKYDISPPSPIKKPENNKQVDAPTVTAPSESKVIQSSYKVAVVGSYISNEAGVSSSEIKEARAQITEKLKQEGYDIVIIKPNKYVKPWELKQINDHFGDKRAGLTILSMPLLGTGTATKNKDGKFDYKIENK
jgi:hypothetical protein